MDIANASRARNIAHSVGMRIQEHRVYGNILQTRWSPFEGATRPMLPKGAVAAMSSVGVVPFYLPDLQVIDTMGLTDVKIAHSPVKVPNQVRQMAHDRRPPPGYLHQRGVNFIPYPATRDEKTALIAADYAVEVRPGVWLPFDALSRDWVAQRFSDRKLAQRHMLPHQIVRQRIEVGQRVYVPRRLLDDFETDREESWTINTGMHIETLSTPVRLQLPVFGRVGQGLLNSFDRRLSDCSISRATRHPFRVKAGDHLVFFIGGGAGPHVGVRLLVDGRPVMHWRGQNTEILRAVAYPLSAYVGRDLSLEVYDEERGPWGHVLVDHFMLARELKPADAGRPSHPEPMRTAQ
jgi:hypothetical protein